MTASPFRSLLPGPARVALVLPDLLGRGSPTPFRGGPNSTLNRNKQSLDLDISTIVWLKLIINVRCVPFLWFRCTFCIQAWNVFQGVVFTRVVWAWRKGFQCCISLYNFACDYFRSHRHIQLHYAMLGLTTEISCIECDVPAFVLQNWVDKDCSFNCECLAVP